jgi:hypothetical protein
MLTIVALGTCTISATQAGSNYWLAATPVSQSFTVNPPVVVHKAVLAAPTDLTATITAGSLTATWAPVSLATSYLCTLMLNLTTPTSITVATTSTSCTFSGLDPTVDYGVSVVALNPNETSSLPALALATVTLSIPGRPSVRVTSPTKGRVVTTRMGATGLVGQSITGYQYSLDGGGWRTVTLNSSGAFTIRGLRSGSRHSIRLRAVNATGPGLSSIAARIKVK